VGRKLRRGSIPAACDFLKRRSARDVKFWRRIRLEILEFPNISRKWMPLKYPMDKIWPGEPRAHVQGEENVILMKI
jgi:hypothetical protein